MRNVTIWSQDNCPVCDRVKAIFANDTIDERQVTELISGCERNDEALAQLAMQDMMVPLVKVDGKFVSLDDVLAAEDAAA